MIYLVRKINKLEFSLKSLFIFYLFISTGFFYNSTRVFSTSNGLSDNNISDISQDNYGQLWVATESGISIFNGSIWTTYSTRFNHSGNPFGLILKDIKSIQIDNSGNKYFLTKDGYVILLRELEARLLISPVNDKSGFSEIQVVKENGSEILWASSSGNGLFFYSNGWFSFSEKEGLLSNRVLAIKSFNDFLIVVSDKGIQFLKNRRVIFTYPSKYFDNKKYISIIFDNLNRVKGDIPSVFILSDNRLLHFVNESLEDVTIKFFAPYRERFIQVNSNGSDRLFLVSDNYVKIVNLTSFTSQIIDQEHGIRSKITKIFTDRESNLWIGTERGLIRLTSTNLTTYSTQNGLAENHITTIAKLENEFYLGHKSGRITVFRNKRFDVIDLNSELNRYKISPDRKNEIKKIISTEDALILMIDDWGIFEYKRYNRLRPIYTVSNVKEKIFDIILSKNKKPIIVGIFDKDKSQNRVISYDVKFIINENTIPFHGNVIRLMQSRDGTLWFVNQEQKVFKFFNERYEEFDVLNRIGASKINFIVEDRGANIAFGTDQGILILLKSGDTKVLQIPASENHNRFLEIYSGYFDELNNLWMLTNQGLIFWNWRDIKYSTEWRTILPYVLNTEALVPDNGNMYVASENGLHVLPKDENLIKILKPSVFITDLIVDGKSKINSSVIELEEVKDLIIRFNGILLSSNDNIRYSYRLDGLDKEWSEPVNAQEVRYTNLSPGTYQFFVRARTNLTDWSQPAVSPVIKISKPFYKNYQIISIFLLTSFVLTLLTLLILRKKKIPNYELVKLKNQLEHLEKQNKELRVEISKALSQSRSRMSFIASLSHELRTPITSLIGFTDILLDPKLSLSEDERKKYLNYISINNRRLLILVNDIIDLAKIDSGHLKLEDSPVNINAEIRDTVNLFKEKIRTKNLDLIFDLDSVLDTEKILIDKNRLHQVISNLVSNSIKFTETGFIKITSKRMEEKILISIEDSGIGIPEEDLPFIFEEFRRSSIALRKSIDGSGLGLSITKKILDLMGGKIEVESAEGLGSKFIITLPIKSSSEKKSQKGIQKGLN